MSGGEVCIPRTVIGGIGGKFVAMEVAATGLPFELAAPTGGGLGAADNCVELRTESVKGNEVLHCGHAATFPSSSSGATNSFPHFGQRTVMDIRWKLRTCEWEMPNEPALHFQSKEKVIQRERTQDNQHGGCHDKYAGQEHLHTGLASNRFGALRSLDAQQIRLSAKNVRQGCA